MVALVLTIAKPIIYIYGDCRIYSIGKGRPAAGSIATAKKKKNIYIYIYIYIYNYILASLGARSSTRERGSGTLRHHKLVLDTPRALWGVKTACKLC